SNDPTPTITGSTDAAPGSTVTLVVTGSDHVSQTFTTTVGTDGSYSVDVPADLAEGGYSVAASVTDPAGNTGSADDTGVIDTVAPTISVDAPALSNDPTPTITGSTDAAPGSTVTLVVTGSDHVSQTFTTTVGTDGSYSVDVPADLAEGGYTVTASVTDPAGNTGTADDTGTFAPLAATEDTVASFTVADLLGATGSGLTVTSVSIGNGTATITGGGSAISYTPSENYSGETTLTYTLSDGSTATAQVSVAPVTDMPTATDGLTFTISGTSFSTYSWSNITSVKDGSTTYNLLKNGGDGADSEDLVNAIDYLVAHNMGSATQSTTTSLESSSLPTYQAKLITGYIYLEAGQTYEFSGTVDDSGTIVIGDAASGHANWRGTSTSTESTFTVDETGFYTFDLYLHNASGVGNYDFSVVNTDGSEVPLFGNLSDVQDAISSYNYLSLGSFDDGSDADGNGFYGLDYGYTGTEGSGIPLTGVGANLTDTDGSESLTMTVSGLVEGATLNYDVVYADGTTGTGTAVADSSGTITVTGGPGAVQLSYLTLDIPAGTYDVLVTATAQDGTDAPQSSTIEFTVNSTPTASGFSAFTATAFAASTEATDASPADSSSTVALYADTTSIWDDSALKTASHY
ncbi:beta strand repeat-containing protein, partial [Paenirhodobacter huangdaonensis]